MDISVKLQKKKEKYQRWAEKHWAEYYKKNKEKIKARSAERRKRVGYTEEQRVQRRAYTRQWKAINVDKVRNYHRQWIDSNRIHVNQYNLNQYYKNHEAGKLKNRKQYYKNPDIYKENAERYRAKQYSVTIEKFKKIEIYERDNWICQLCGKPVNKCLKRPDPFSPSLDHIIPLSLGGTHERKNAQLAHLVCNMKKGNRGRLNSGQARA